MTFQIFYENQQWTGKICQNSRGRPAVSSGDLTSFRNSSGPPKASSTLGVPGGPSKQKLARSLGWRGTREGCFGGPAEHDASALRLQHRPSVGHLVNRGADGAVHSPFAAEEIRAENYHAGAPGILRGSTLPLQTLVPSTERTPRKFLSVFSRWCDFIFFGSTTIAAPSRLCIRRSAD